MKKTSRGPHPGKLSGRTLIDFTDLTISMLTLHAHHHHRHHHRTDGVRQSFGMGG